MKTILLFIGFVFVSIHPVDAQPMGKIPRIGFLDSSTASGMTVLVDVFRQELSKLGWIEGKNVVTEHRYSEGRDDRLPELAADLVVLRLI